jgi:tRNA-dihydrouridine synthase A
MLKVSVAPMMDISDIHFRYFIRQISRSVTLYTEMVVVDTVLHNRAILQYNQIEHPVIVQLGGSDLQKLAYASQICEELGYDGINLNVGCPSSRVQSGNFGACLMETPELVAECLHHMQSVVTIPVSVKFRTGIGYQQNYDKLYQFTCILHQSGCKKYIVHARNAILNGMSPKSNRTIPPIDYNMVYQLKRDFPDSDIVINGAIHTVDEVVMHTQYVDGVMLGREIVRNPLICNEIDQYNGLAPVTRKDVIQNMITYISNCEKQGMSLRWIVKHLSQLYYKCSCAKKWRQLISSLYNASAIQITAELTKFLIACQCKS